MKCVILAGGSGTRFWPYSRHSKPKQLLNIIGETSMLQMTIDRLIKVKRVTDIYIITREDLYETIIKDVKGVKPENVIVEPSGKNTAPAIGMMAALFALENPETLMGVFPADHLIVGHNEFSKTITSAARLAKQGKSLVTIGIKPTYPSTAYGYIQHDEITEKGYENVYHVKTFAEKPHKKLAERFINSGDFVWNAGIFFWNVNTFMISLEKHMPDLAELLIQIAPKLREKTGFDEIWDLIDPQSIDYGLLEKVNNIYVVNGKFKWNDVGSWRALYDLLNKNKEGNIIRGNGKVIAGKNNLIQSNGKFTAVIGVNNLVVINTQDATLVVPKDQVEEVKGLVTFLKENGQGELT